MPGGIGAIMPVSGADFWDLPVQWHCMGFPEGECDVCIRQHIMGTEADSQAMPQARGASGNARRAMTTEMAWARLTAKRIAQRESPLCNYNFPQNANETAPMRNRNETA